MSVIIIVAGDAFCVRAFFFFLVLVQPYLGLAAPQKVKIYVVLSPVGPYYKVFDLSRLCMSYPRGLTVLITV